jgi:hypothetical protein
VHQTRAVRGVHTRPTATIHSFAIFSSNLSLACPPSSLLDTIIISHPFSFFPVGVETRESKLFVVSAPQQQLLLTNTSNKTARTLSHDVPHPILEFIHPILQINRSNRTMLVIYILPYLFFYTPPSVMMLIQLSTPSSANLPSYHHHFLLFKANHFIPFFISKYFLVQIQSNKKVIAQ